MIPGGGGMGGGVNNKILDLKNVWVLSVLFDI